LEVDIRLLEHPVEDSLEHHPAEDSLVAEHCNSLEEERRVVVGSLLAEGGRSVQAEGRHLVLLAAGKLRAPEPNLAFASCGSAGQLHA